jgi:hypothetical protein
VRVSQVTARKSAMERLLEVTDAQNVCRDFQNGTSFKALNARRTRALRALLKERAEAAVSARRNTIISAPEHERRCDFMIRAAVLGRRAR